MPRPPEGNSILPGDTFPTSRLTECEIADGWVQCTDPKCKPTMGKYRISGPHAHRVLGKEAK